MFNIPLALIGALRGHFNMGLDFTLPSLFVFVSLAGIVVNDSILLVLPAIMEDIGFIILTVRSERTAK